MENNISLLRGKYTIRKVYCYCGNEEKHGKTFVNHWVLQPNNMEVINIGCDPTLHSTLFGGITDCSICNEVNKQIDAREN